MKRDNIKYCPLTGLFSRDGQPAPVIKKGAAPSVINIHTSKGRTKVPAAHLAWTLHHRVAPTKQQTVLCIDGDRTNLRIDNLELAPASVHRYRQKLPKHNKSGVRNVSWHSVQQRFVVKVRANGICHHIGSFTDIDEAAAAALAARKQLHGRFAATT